jgi:anti-anti-sigma factor
MQIRTDGATLVLAGDFDARSTFQVRTALYDLLAAHDDVVVDLSAVEAVDLIALKVLAAASRRSVQAGRRLTLRGCGPAVRRILHVSRLARVVAMDRASA